MAIMPPPETESNFQALVQAFVMIVVSEIGDKTFLIAAIMAGRHSRMTVFGGAFLSLVVMSILSAALGKVILGLIPKVWTLWAAAILFLVFGAKMLQESLSMSSTHMSEEMREVEEELEHDSSQHDTSNPRGSAIPLEDVEEGHAGIKVRDGSPSPIRPRSTSPLPGPGTRVPSPKIALSFPLSGAARPRKQWHEDAREGVRNIIQLLTSPVFAQAFVLTFLGEWGDRSQITTIAMGGAHSIPVIAFGTILGHGLCTFGAVMGGRYLSTKISVKHISLLGAVAFVIFAILYSYEAYHTPWDATSGDDLDW